MTKQLMGMCGSSLAGKNLKCVETAHNGQDATFGKMKWKL